MTTIKTQDLTGAALDWAVAVAVGLKSGNELHIIGGRPFSVGPMDFPEGAKIKEPISPSTEWSQGGHILSNLINSGFQVSPGGNADVSVSNFDGEGIPYGSWEDVRILEDGPTPLIAACRAIVASKLGDEVDVPEELL